MTILLSFHVCVTQFDSDAGAVSRSNSRVDVGGSGAVAVTPLDLDPLSLVDLSKPGSNHNRQKNAASSTDGTSGGGVLPPTRTGTRNSLTVTSTNHNAKSSQPTPTIVVQPMKMKTNFNVPPDDDDDNDRATITTSDLDIFRQQLQSIKSRTPINAHPIPPKTTMPLHTDHTSPEAS